jgi:hypothetical protein
MVAQRPAKERRGVLLEPSRPEWLTPQCVPLRVTPTWPRDAGGPGSRRPGHTEKFLLSFAADVKAFAGAIGQEEWKAQHPQKLSVVSNREVFASIAKIATLAQSGPQIVEVGK